MNGQQQIDWNPATHTHRTDPDTSLAAARKAAGTARRHCDLIQQALEMHRRDGLTASEVASVVGLEMVQVNRRVSDLIRAGRAHRTDARRRNDRGNLETVIYPGKSTP